MLRVSFLEVVFYKTSGGREPVRDWLKDLPKQAKKIIGENIKIVQYGWPVGMPVVRKLEKDIWEIRSHLGDGIARVLFTVELNNIVLLHGFIKKTRKTPLADLKLARLRLRDIKGDDYEK